MIHDSPFTIRRCRGQSLIEILIGIAVGVIMIVGSITIVISSLKSSGDAAKVQASTAIGKELLENVRAWTEGDWHGIANLNVGSANHYYLISATSPFTAVSGDETVSAGGIPYTRYFVVDAVARDGGGKIVAGVGADDPSTKKITVTVSWQAANVPTTIAEYLTRNAHRVFIQTDWSGGGGQDGPITSANSRFSNATDADYTSITGSLKIKF